MAQHAAEGSDGLIPNSREMVWFEPYAGACTLLLAPTYPNIPGEISITADAAHVYVMA